MRTVIVKVLVARFYQANAGFFLLILLLMFGLLNARATVELHHAIMQAITGSWFWGAMAMMLWVVYNLKCVSFVVQSIHMPAHSFLYGLQAVDNKRQLRLLLQAHTAIYQPALLYGAVAAIVGFTEGQIVLPVMILFFQFAMCVGGALVARSYINSTWKKPLITLPAVRLFQRQLFWFYLLQYSLSYRKGTFIGIKLFSLLLLQGMVLANANKVSKEAICILIMFLVSAHTLLPAYYSRFMEEEVLFVRNMPRAISRTFSLYTLTYLLVFLPETLFLMLNNSHVVPLPTILSLYALAVSHMLLCTALLYLGITRDRYTMCVFGMFFLSLLLLATSGLGALAAAEAVAALLLYRIRYYRYERM